MIAKKVYEFQQGRDPYKVMGLGEPQVGNKYICIQELFWHNGDLYTTAGGAGWQSEPDFKSDDIYIIIEIDSEDTKLPYRTDNSTMKCVWIGKEHLEKYFKKIK
jgi:hypothetical protein